MMFVFKAMRGLIRSSHLYKNFATRFVSIQKSQRSFHTNVNLCLKMFLEHENRYAYGLMENKGYTISLNVAKSTDSLTKDEFEGLMKENWSKVQPKQLYEAFPLLGSYCSTHGLCISDKMFDNFIDNLTDNIKHASDQELESIFYSLVKWPETESIRTRNYIEVWAALDDVCLNRIRTWTHKEMLRFVALFFMLNVSKVSDFTLKSINKLATKAKQLTPNELVQTMFYVGVLRRQPHDMHNLELRITDCFDELSLDDIAIMCMGFFKSKTPIRSMELVSKIINKIIENPKSLHEVSVAALLKVIRYSLKISTDDKIYRLLDSLQHEVPRLSVMCVIHLALLGTTTLTLHKDCLTKIAERVIDSLPSARLKDLERLVLTYGTFNFVPQIGGGSFFEKIIEELRKSERNEEIHQHGRSFACCISYLGLLGIYPVDLMDKTLSPKFLENTYGKQCHGYGREILTIHNTSLLFCPDAKMNRLSDKEAIVVAKRYTDFVPNEDYKKQFNVTERMFLHLHKALEEIQGGSEYVKGDHILPHHQRGDLIICNNSNGVPLTVTDKLCHDFGLIRRPPDNNNWIVLVVAGRNAIIRDTNTPSGQFYAKLRELNALGFHGVLVPWSTYINMKTKEQLSVYIKELIKDALK